MLDTLDDIKARLGLTGTDDDGLLAAIQTGAEALIVQRTGRDFVPGTYTEDFPGSQTSIQLRNYPVDGVQVYVDGLAQFGSETEMPADYYRLDPVRGSVRCLVGPFSNFFWSWPCWAWVPNWQRYPGTVRAVYTTSAAVPAVVREALAMLVGYAYRQAKTTQAAGQLNLTRNRVGDTYQYFETGADESFDGALQLLDGQRVPAV